MHRVCMAQMNLTATRTYDAAPETMWAVIADLDGYADHVGGLAITEVVDGSNLGAQRRCETTGGDDWYERVVAWDEGRRYDIEVDTSTYPTVLRSVFSSFRGTWTVEPEADGSRVTIDFTGTVRGGRLAASVVQRMARRNQQDIEATLVSYGEAVRTRS